MPFQLSTGASNDFSMFDTIDISYADISGGSGKGSFPRRIQRANVADCLTGCFNVTITDTAPLAVRRPGAGLPASATPGVLRLGSPSFAGGEGGNARVTV